MSFGTPTAIILTGASLASAASRQGTAIGPIGGSPVDIQIQFKCTTGSTGTSATGVVNIYVATSTDPTNIGYSDNAAGPDGAITPTVPPNSTLLFQLNTVANSVTYETPMMSLAQKLGSVPNYFNIFITNLSGHALAATATVLEYTVIT